MRAITEQTAKCRAARGTPGVTARGTPGGAGSTKGPQVPRVPASPPSSRKSRESRQVPRVPKVPRVPRSRQVPQVPQVPASPASPPSPPSPGKSPSPPSSRKSPKFPQVPQVPQVPKSPKFPQVPQVPASPYLDAVAGDDGAVGGRAALEPEHVVGRHVVLVLARKVLGHGVELPRVQPVVGLHDLHDVDHDAPVHVDVAELVVSHPRRRDRALDERVPQRARQRRDAAEAAEAAQHVAGRQQLARALKQVGHVEAVDVVAEDDVGVAGGDEVDPRQQQVHLALEAVHRRALYRLARAQHHDVALAARRARAVDAERGPDLDDLVAGQRPALRVRAVQQPHELAHRRRVLLLALVPPVPLVPLLRERAPRHLALLGRGVGRFALAGHVLVDRPAPAPPPPPPPPASPAPLGPREDGAARVARQQHVHVVRDGLGGARHLLLLRAGGPPVFVGLEREAGRGAAGAAAAAPGRGPEEGLEDACDQEALCVVVLHRAPLGQPRLVQVDREASVVLARDREVAVRAVALDVEPRDEHRRHAPRAAAASREQGAHLAPLARRLDLARSRLPRRRLLEQVARVDAQPAGGLDVAVVEEAQHRADVGLVLLQAQGPEPGHPLRLPQAARRVAHRLERLERQPEEVALCTVGEAPEVHARDALDRQPPERGADEPVGQHPVHRVLRRLAPHAVGDRRRHLDVEVRREVLDAQAHRAPVRRHPERAEHVLEAVRPRPRPPAVLVIVVVLGVGVLRPPLLGVALVVLVVILLPMLVVLVHGVPVDDLELQPPVPARARAHARVLLSAREMLLVQRSARRQRHPCCPCPGQSPFTLRAPRGPPENVRSEQKPRERWRRRRR
jgi:hypothetical protein